MTDQDRLEFSQLLTRVHAYYRQDLTPDLLDMWWFGLERFDLAQIRRALSQHAADPEAGKFSPKISDVVKVLAGTATDRAAIAWGKTHEAMGSVGAYSDVVFDDATVHAVVEDLGGWPKMCRTELKELSYLQHRFTESYRAYAGRVEFPYPKRLAGDRSPDSEYERKGLPLPRPALVGDPEKCRLVYKGGGASKALVSFQSIQQLAAPTGQERLQ